MEDSVESIDLPSGVATSEESNGVAMYLPHGCLTVSTTGRDPIIPPARSKVLHPAQMMQLDRQLWQPAVAATAKKKQKKKRYVPCYPGCLLLAYVVSGMFYSVVANRHQPNLHIHLVYIILI